MSIKILDLVLTRSQRKGGELLVMLVLADFANDRGECWPSIPGLATKAHLTERQTRKILKKLEESREISCVKSNGGRNRRNHYIITLSENAEIKTLKKEQGTKNPVFDDTETLSATTGALNRHITVNKRETESAKLIPDSFFSDPQTLPLPPKKRKQVAPDPIQREAFARFYEAYPRHVARAEAEKAWLNLNPNPELVAMIMTGVERYRAEKAGSEQKYIKHPASWLRAQRWEDELETASNGNGHEKPVEVKDLGNGIVEVDGLKMARETYERKYARQGN